MRHHAGGPSDHLPSVRFKRIPRVSSTEVGAYTGTVSPHDLAGPDTTEFSSTQYAVKDGDLQRVRIPPGRK